MYDVAIIGGGPGGITAAIYAVRYGLKTLVIAKEAGGWMAQTQFIENWPGDVKPVGGFELGQRFKEHMVAYGAELKEEEVDKLDKTTEGFTVHTTEENEFSAKALVIATGSHKRKLNVPGEEKFAGKGISYCVTCDGPLFKDKKVAVAGGGDSAAEAALMLAEYAQKVVLLVREQGLSAKAYLIDRIKQNSKIELKTNVTISEALGDQFLNAVKLSDGSTENLEGLFVEVGMIPAIELAEQLGIETEAGLIKVKADMSTSIQGVYGSGDITTGSNKLRQIVTAAGEGAIAANSIFRFLRA